MSMCFTSCYSGVFNAAIGSWTTAQVTNMFFMFYYVGTQFTQNLSGWNVGSISNCSSFRGGYPSYSGLSCSNTPALPSSCTGC
jgi:hypothetical protein